VGWDYIQENCFVVVSLFKTNVGLEINSVIKGEVADFEVNLSFRGLLAT